MQNATANASPSAQSAMWRIRLFGDMRRNLTNAQHLSALLLAVLGGGEDDEPLDIKTDRFNCFGIVADLVESSYDAAEQLEGDNRSFSLYTLKMQYVEQYLRLLATKAGCSDFDRAAAAGLAEQLVSELYDEMENYSNQYPGDQLQ